MALILTYLGKGGCGSTTLSIATAKRLAHHGRRVLLCIQDSSPGPSVLLGQALPVEPAELSSNLWAMQFSHRSPAGAKLGGNQGVRSPVL